MTISDIRIRLRETLKPKYGEREATAMARIILMHLKRWDFPTLLANEEREASDYIVNRSEEILAQLLKGMPLQYALGETLFYGLTLSVAPGVLIPRPETEELVDIIVSDNDMRRDLRVLDLCTGSGAIALALARNLPFSSVDAVDISPDAVALARKNADALKIKLNISRGDVFTLSLHDDEFDIIVSNPPYVDESEKAEMEENVLDYEPHEALFVPDSDSLMFYRRITALASRALKSWGKLYFEINPRHASELMEMLRKEGFEDIEIIKDIHGKDRFAKAVKAND